MTLDTAGNQSITAKGRRTPGLDGERDGHHGPGRRGQLLVVSGFPTTDTAGVAHDVTVIVHDPYGNVATGYTGTVELTSTDPQAVLPALHLHRDRRREHTPSP